MVLNQSDWLNFKSEREMFSGCATPPPGRIGMTISLLALF